MGQPVVAERSLDVFPVDLDLDGVTAISLLDVSKIRPVDDSSFEHRIDSFRDDNCLATFHQHGVALTPGEGRLLIVGTGPAGGVSGGPGLTILDLGSGAEEILALTRPHETVAVSRDGRLAYLTGGYLLTGGWDGLTVVDLETQATREVPVPNGPLDIALLP